MADMSRFATTADIVFSGQSMPGHWSKPELLNRELTEQEVIYYKVSNAFAGKPASIAWEIYGNTLLDWLVISSCNALDVFGWPPSGELLRLPSRELVLGELL